jgi:gametolysin|nr:MAG TPA: lysin [Caudoviricetes sp.]
MVKTLTIVNEVKKLADYGIGVDQDGVWGTQCVDEPNYISVKYFNKPLWGNAIDLLDSAKALGYRVEYNELGNIESRPRAGAVFVMDTTYIYGHPFGHTGVVIEDSDGYTMKTVEQNVDGNADSLTVGGPARYVTRNFDGIVGWFYFPTDDSDETVPETSDLLTLPEVRVYTVGVEKLNIRNAPSLDAEIVGTYEQGEEFNYMEFINANGYEWLSYVSNSGVRRYVASMNLETFETHGTWRRK